MNRGHEIKVLDHGYVKLIDWMGSDEAIIEAARMSTGKGFVSWDPYMRCKQCGQVQGHLPGGLERIQVCFSTDCNGRGSNDFEKSPRGDAGLLTFLYANKHMTPFECGGEMMIEVQAPIMVFREWHRHRTQAYNEFSARYAQMPNLHYLPEPERIQKQSATNKQGSGEAFDGQFGRMMVQRLDREQQGVYAHYEELIGDGVAKEVARLNTPVSRYSKMRAKTDLRNWLGFLLLRMAPNAQWEIRQYASAVAEMVKAIWPRTYALFEEHDLHGVHLSRSEAAAVAGYLSNTTVNLGHHKELLSKFGIKVPT